MSTSSDDVRGYIAGLEADRLALAEVRAMIDVFRRNALPDSSVTNRMETDAEVIARVAAAPKSMHTDLARAISYDPCANWSCLLHVATSAKAVAAVNEGIRTGLRASAILAGDHDDGDEHDACLDALATKILGTTAEGARSLVEAYDKSARSRTASKPCPMKDCDLPCDDGHKHFVEKTDEPRPTETTTTPGPKPIKLRVGQIWQLPAGNERQITGSLWADLPGYVSLGGASVCIDKNNYVTDTGGCTLVYDPRGTK